jgi:hypothetical protein
MYVLVMLVGRPAQVQQAFLLLARRKAGSKLLPAFCVLPQLAISGHFTVNLHKSLIGALSFNFARHRQLRQHAVTTSASLSAVVCRSICCYVLHCLFVVRWGFL